MSQATARVQLLTRVTCPHCWKTFAPEDVLWISSSPDLMGDEKLGADSPRRFLPSRFNVQGNAMDQQGSECQELACPNCHLPIPRSVISLPSFYVSIAGTPSCGKSYFLASMTWQLRHNLPSFFECTFGDADPSFNKLLNDYEEQQFFNPKQDEIVKLAKTQEYGDLYSQVQLGGQTYSFPQPFLFLLRPGEGHASFKATKSPAKCLCLYDNAGESYQAGKDSVTNQVTRHLAVAHAYLFCFDPTQDPRFRQACSGNTNDYQVVDAPVTARQETLLYELIQRVRKHTSLGERDRTKKPLFILCTKYDSWHSLLGESFLKPPIVSLRQGVTALDMPRIQEVSRECRRLMSRFSPELISAAEAFSENVIVLPVSATGVAPERDPKTGIFGVRPKDMKPMWCDVPILVALARWAGGLIPFRGE